MHSIFHLLLLFLTSSTTTASTLIAKNLCPGSVWLTRVYGSNDTSLGTTELASGEGYLETALQGQGNSLGVSREDSYFSGDTPKLILGTTTQDGVLYWSLSTVDGDPFAAEGIKVTSPDGTGNNVCGVATYRDGVVHGCQDGKFTLTLDLCSR